MDGVSCLCLTYGRGRLLEEAIESFLRQDWPGPKELIVLNDHPDQELVIDHPEILVNLLQNAREALGEQGGNIWIEARCNADYSISISVRDDGPGIPRDKQERIFEPYYTTKEKGTGIGLATVRHNVELYGGSIRLESELGNGARFSLLFPAKTLMRLDKA